MTLRIISNNSFRILGVFGNSSKKEILSNVSKFNAFLRVNQPVPALPQDMSVLLPPVKRDLDIINNAEGEVSISRGRLTHCFFWFVNTGATDKEGLNLLAKGNVEDATRMWRNDGSIGSLQNLMVCYLITNRYREAVILAHNLLTVHFDKWRGMFSLLSDVSDAEVAHLFLDALYVEIPKDLVSMNWNGIPQEWEHYVKKKTAIPKIDEITALIELSKNSDDLEGKCQNGFSLLEKALPLLQELESLLSPDDITLLSIEDKVYSEVLNCCISSYNYAYDKLCNGDDDLYRQIAPRCKELVNRINTEKVSATLATRINENKSTINEKCQDIEKTIERAQNVMIKCPECGEESSAIKHYTMIRWALFLFIGAQTQRVTYTCCPKCMRKHILWHGFTYNIITGNVLWFLLILPWSLILLIMSFTKGHSSSVLSMIEKD